MRPRSRELDFHAEAEAIRLLQLPRFEGRRAKATVLEFLTVIHNTSCTRANDGVFGKKERYQCALPSPAQRAQDTRQRAGDGQLYSLWS